MHQFCDIVLLLIYLVAMKNTYLICRKRKHVNNNYSRLFLFTKNHWFQSDFKYHFRKLKQYVTANLFLNINIINQRLAKEIFE